MQADLGFLSFHVCQTPFIHDNTHTALRSQTTVSKSRNDDDNLVFSVPFDIN